MKSKFILSIVGILTGFFQLCQAQGLGMGQWRTHLSYHQGRKLCLANDKIFCATSGGLYYYHISKDYTGTLSKVDGLSDIIVGDMAYHSKLNRLIIGYQSGKIDIILPDRILNLGDIFQNSLLTNATQIQNINIYKNQAILCGGFGISIFDLEKLEFKDSYTNISPTGDKMMVYKTAIVNDTIFMASARGVFKASFTQSNLFDYRNWKLNSPKNKAIKQLVIHEGNLFSWVENDGLYKYVFGNWNLVWATTAEVRSLRSGRNGLLISTPNVILKYNDANTSIDTIPCSIQANGYDLIDAESGNYWLADDYWSLTKITNGSATAHYPNGVYANEHFKLYNFEDKIVAMAGGYLQSFGQINNPNGFYLMRNDRWENYNVQLQNIPYMLDFVDAAYNPINQKLYLASQGYGVLEMNLVNGIKRKISDTTEGSTLKSLANRGDNYLRIPAVAVDQSGVLWISNQSNIAYNIWEGIHSMTTRKKFTGYKFPSMSSQFFVSGGVEIKIDKNNNKWVRNSQNNIEYGSGGFMVFNEKTNQARAILSGSTAGNLVSSTVNCFDIDLNGEVWIGTNKGINVVYNTSDVFNKLSIASTPLFEGRPLLFKQNITAIKTDGANRKWIATSLGVSLYTPDGSQELLHFTETNSPLLSNQINDIAINGVTGEVFFATSKGLVSYRSDANIGKNETPDPDKVQIFPNPVREDFEGLIGIQGIANASIVKIVNVNGDLVYETKSQGGTATWNGHNYQGKKVPAGIYVVLSTNDQGEFGFAGKILITR